MLYVAFIKNRPRWQLGHSDLQAKSRRWWNEGGRPAGIRTLGFYGTLGTETPDVIIFEAASHDDIRRMIEYWHDLDFEVHPAIDLADAFRRQGMKIG